MVDQHVTTLRPYEEGATDTIDLDNLYVKELSSSGSFDLRGVGTTSLGKLLRALPIPALLVDQSHRVVFANEAAGDAGADYVNREYLDFSSFFSPGEPAVRAHALIERGFNDRKRIITEVDITLGARRIAGRMHLRSLRLGKQRYVLVLVEDLTLERQQLLLTKRHSEEIAGAHEALSKAHAELRTINEELERRVQERTAELARANEELRREMTERKRAQELVIHTARIKAVAELSSGVAHHFNNMLQILLGSAQLALINLDAGDYAEVKSDLQDIVRGSKFGADVVKRLQSFTQVQAGKRIGGVNVFDLSDTVKEAVELSRPAWQTHPESRGVRVSLSHDLQPGCLVSGQEHQLFETAVSLIKNASEALPDGGDIRVSTGMEGTSVMLRVEDNGIGIPQECLGKVVEPFWTTKGVQVLGMGLPSSLGIVKQHAGEIDVHSRVGEGTTVTVTLPLAVTAEAGRSTHAESRPSPALNILVIDDMEPLLELLEEGLAHFGHTVTTALTGIDGLDLYQRGHFDLVVCDLGIPGLDGWEVAQHIRALCEKRRVHKTPFILLTGWGEHLEESRRVEESGVDRVVSKPVDIAELLEILKDVVDKAEKRPI